MNAVPQPAPEASAALASRSPGRSILTLQQHREAMPTSDELSELMRAVASAQDRQAFALLFRHFAPRVKSYLMRGGSAEGLAEELAQETMVSVWRKAALFDAGQAGVSTWIFTIARNLRVDHFRRHGHTLVDGLDHGGDDIPDDAPALDDQLHAGRREHCVREAMKKLSPDQSQVLRLSFYEELPHAQIATELGIPLGTVKSRVRLAVTHLRRLLGELEP
jgi:RNA polymerase sigma-70 factor (ECF subfamily)